MNLPSTKTKRIGKHYFRLTGKDNLYFKGQHIANFTPLPKKQVCKHLSKHTRNRSILPTFNNDRKHYTSAFQLPSTHLENQEQMAQQHEKRAAEALLSQTSIWMPKPRSRHKYCGVCRGHYEDYKEHLETQLHLTSLKNSRYQEMIVNLCSRVRQSIQKTQRKEQQQGIVIDLTTEEALNKVPELVETSSSTKGVLS